MEPHQDTDDHRASQAIGAIPAELLVPHPTTDISTNLSQFMPDPIEIFGQITTPSRKARREDEEWIHFIFGSDDDKEVTPAGILGMDVGVDRGRKTNIGADSSIHTESNDNQFLNIAEASSITGATVQTAENTYLNNYHSPRPSSENCVSVSETDFLSQLSPMGGYIDEGLCQMSVYNNPARTVQSVSSTSSSSVFGPQNIQRKGSPFRSLGANAQHVTLHHHGQYI